MLKKQDESPLVMERDEAAAFLGMTERELMRRSEESDFPHHAGYWGRRWYAVSELKDWKAKERLRTMRGEPVQLELQTKTALPTFDLNALETMIAKAVEAAFEKRERQQTTIPRHFGKARLNTNPRAKMMFSDQPA